MKKTDELDDFGFLIKSSVLRGIVPRLERVKRSVRLVMVTNVLMIVLVFIPQIAGKLAGGRAPAILKTWTGKAVAIPMAVGISVLFLLASAYYCRKLIWLKKYEPSVPKAAICGLIVYAASRVGLVFLFRGYPGLDIIVVVFWVLMMVAYIRVLRESMWEMTREVSHAAAEHWRDMFRYTLITGVATLLPLMIMHYLDVDFHLFPERFVNAMTAVDLLVVTIAFIVLQCMELYCLEKAVLVFSRVTDPNEEDDENNPYAR